MSPLILTIPNSGLKGSYIYVYMSPLIPTISNSGLKGSYHDLKAGIK